MNGFELDEILLQDHERFARSFVQIRVPDVRAQVEEIYASDRFWPEPLISINPRFERGASVTTGTGSGTSPCFFIPIIDAAIRARAAGQPARARAIYPMNALANSQREKIDKFIKRAGLPDHLRPTFARYTGQESSEEPEHIRESKPDILPTNFMMLELLMTRQNSLDRAVTQTGTTGVS